MQASAALAPFAASGGPSEFKLSDADFRTFASIAYQRSGIVLAAAKKNLVYGRLTRRLRTLGLESFEDYRKLLEQDGSDEIEHFINALSTNHTKFFRELHHFDHFTAEVLRPFGRNRATKDRLRVWSAGCSSGEEPYTLAMLLNAEIPDVGSRDIRILATDIDTDVLQRASSGQFSAEAMESIPQKFSNVWSKNAEGGTVRAAEELRSLITFGHLNLLEEWPMRGPFDAIFCRNVMIYFDQPTKSKLIERFTDHLKVGGWLYIGHSESLVGSQTRLRLTGRTIYQRAS